MASDVVPIIAVLQAGVFKAAEARVFAKQKKVIHYIVSHYDRNKPWERDIATMIHFVADITVQTLKAYLFTNLA